MNGINGNQQQNQESTFQEVSHSRKKQRKKILQAIDTNVFVVRKHIVQAKCNNFSVKQIKPLAPVKITVECEEEVDKVKNALKSANVSYHEFKWEDEKSKCFIIRGLVGVKEEDLSVIKDQLIQKGIPSDINLSLHITGYMRSNSEKIHNPFVKLVVPPNFDDKMLQNIRCINHVAVRFDYFKSSSIIQCKNCQRFGHSAGGCQHNHRCVKCGLNHFKEECPRTLNKHHKLKCCNCNGEHTANNLSACVYFQKNFVKSQRNENGELPSASSAEKFNNTRKAGVSFASALLQN